MDPAIENVTKPALIMSHFEVSPSDSCGLSLADRFSGPSRHAIKIRSRDSTRHCWASWCLSLSVGLAWREREWEISFLCFPPPSAVIFPLLSFDLRPHRSFAKFSFRLCRASTQSQGRVWKHRKSIFLLLGFCGATCDEEASYDFCYYCGWG